MKEKEKPQASGTWGEGQNKKSTANLPSPLTKINQAFQATFPKRGEVT